MTKGLGRNYARFFMRLFSASQDRSHEAWAAGSVHNGEDPQRLLQNSVHVDNPKSVNAATVAAIACCAFVITDVAHESLGHGGAYVLLGGRSLILTTTRAIATGPGIDPDRMFAGQDHANLFGRIFSIAGPLASFLLAFVCLLLLKAGRQRISSPAAKLFLWLSAAFSLFWACGYMASSGLTGVGDYFELIRGNGDEWFWRAALVVLGIGLYILALRLLRRHLALAGIENGKGFSRILVIAYVSAALTASLGAALDPRGPIRVLYDAIPATVIANAGMLWLATVSRHQTGAAAFEDSSEEISMPWIFTSLAVLLFYVSVLGPGLSLRL